MIRNVLLGCAAAAFAVALLAAERHPELRAEVAAHLAESELVSEGLAWLACEEHTAPRAVLARVATIWRD